MNIEKKKLIKRLTNNRWILGGLLVVYLIGLSCYLLALHKTNPTKTIALATPATTITSSIANSSSEPHASANNQLQQISYTVKRGDTLSKIFQAEKIPAAVSADIINQPLFFRDFQQVQANETLEFQFNSAHQLQQIIIPTGKDSQLIVNTNPNLSEDINSNTDTRNFTISGKIHNSLYDSMRAAGVPATIIMQFIRIFSDNIDLRGAFHPGDRFAVTYAATYKNHRLVNTTLLAADLKVEDKNHYAILDGNDYYHASGQNWASGFLRFPVHYTYISSTFSLRRYHPILHIYRPHYGVDLAAPAGTPIHATSNGEIIYEGWETGYGKVMMIQDGIYTTRYAHMEAFERSVHLHNYVKEGQVIGFVGMTGLATGPHLHYEVHVYGKPVNPLTYALPSAAPVPPAQYHSFEHYADAVKQLLG